MIMAQGARWAGLVVVTAVALLVAGCGDETVDEPRRATGKASPTSSPRASDAAGALSEYGFVLPEGATGAEVVLLPDQEDQGMLDVYRVTFTAPSDAVTKMCLDAGIGSVGPISRLTDADRELYGVDEEPPGAQTCAASRPSYHRQQLRVLFWGDPASVVVMLYTMPVR